MSESNDNVTSPSAPVTTIAPPQPEKSIFDTPEWTGVEPQQQEREYEPQFAGVRFQPVGKVYHYRADGFGLRVGDWVVVETVRGKQMGQVATVAPPRDKNLGNFRRVDRLATGRDMAMRHYYENKELEAMIACRAESSDLRLPIKIVRAQYSFDGQALTFLFSTIEDQAEVNVEPLRDRISHLYRARVEMRQIGPREVAKLLGGMGACGIEERCCSKFLTEFSPITIKHAKEQNISLNPTDITGMCGRLRCCLIYEFEQYVEARRHLPKLKSMIGTPQGEGKVVEHLALRDSVKVFFDDPNGGRREAIFHREQLVPLEEYRKLQEKAISGKCDKHEGGNCDCGKNKPAQAAAPAEEIAAIPSDPNAPMEVHSGLTEERNRPRRDDRRPDDRRRDDSRRDDRRPDNRRRDEQRSDAKRPDDRHRDDSRRDEPRRRDDRRRDDRRRDDRPQQPPAQSNSPQNTDAPKPQDQARRRPLARRNKSE